MSENNVHAGHRERLRTRYKRCGFDDFQEHEVLELLLFYSIPRANTNPLAHNLLNHFGSLYAVMNASYEALCEVEGVGPASAALIRTVADSARAAKLKELANEPLLSPEKLYIYAAEWFLGKPHGTVAVLLLDAKRKIITVRTIAEEHLRLPASFPEEILRLCQQMDASNVVLMHNHVDGVMEPSYEDIYLTREIYRILKDNGITLLEHMIVHELDAIPCLNISMNEEVSGFPTKYKKQ
ncbi:MAG: RadC family protein [Clostridia bacterium]|nr:RadC family protein [Clostridia bacterium]